MTITRARRGACEVARRRRLLRVIALLAPMLPVVAACSGGGTQAASSGAPATTTTVAPAPFDKTVFCNAYAALKGGPIPADRDVAAAHARVNALGVSVPGELSTQISQMVSEYNAVIDAFAANDFDAQAVVAHASGQVKATLDRLTREANGESLEPEAAVVLIANEVCRPDEPVTTINRDELNCPDGIDHRIVSGQKDGWPVPTATIEEAVEQVRVKLSDTSAKLVGDDPNGVRYRFYDGGLAVSEWVFASTGPIGDGWQPVRFDVCL